MSGQQYLDAAASRARREAKAIERRRRGRRRLALLTGSLALLLLLGVLAAKTGDGDGRTQDPAPPGRAAPQTREGSTPPAQEVLGPLPADIDFADPTDAFAVAFKRPPRAGLLVNLDTGEVLWRRNPDRALPIASLTKMMTALVTADSLEPHDRAKITPAVLH